MNSEAEGQENSEKEERFKEPESKEVKTEDLQEKNTEEKSELVVFFLEKCVITQYLINAFNFANKCGTDIEYLLIFDSLFVI